MAPSGHNLWIHLAFGVEHMAVQQLYGSTANTSMERVSGITMREFETTMTQKGQVTVPAEIRAYLGLKPRDRVRFELEADGVKLRPAQSRIARHFGAVSLVGKPLSIEEERKAFEEGVAQEVPGEDR